MSKTGLVLEGGAFRGIFTAGVLDVMMENNLYTDYAVGVSAGAGNGMAYLSKQIGRTRYVIKPKKRSQSYFGVKQILKTGNFLNLDKMFFEYPYKQYPFDFDTYKNAETELEIVVSNCNTGKAEYHSEKENTDRFLLLGKASCSIPFLCEPVKIGDYEYLDGSICDSIPMQRALDKGCDRLIIIMTKGKGEMPTDYNKIKTVMSLKYEKKYPEFYKALMKRADMYRYEKALLEKLEKEGTALVIRPSIDCIGKFEQNDEKVQEFYHNGCEVAKNRLEEIKEYVSPAKKSVVVNINREQLKAANS